MHVVIIGNGIAGNSAACTIRDARKDVAITIISAEAFPLYSACVLPGYLAGEIDRRKVFLNTEDGYTRADINMLLEHEVTHIDARHGKVLLGTKSIPFDKLIIATGSEPVVPPIEGIEKQGIFTLKSIADADMIANFLGKTAVIIGSGLVGVEAAVALKKKGWDVSLIELLDWILPMAFDEKPSLQLRGILEEHGVKVFTGEKVHRIAGNGKVRSVVTNRQEIGCDMAILATGMRPNIKLARQAELEVGGLGGLRVDNQMMTSIENVYACGDCVETMDAISDKPTLSLLWHNAKAQGMVAGLNSIGIKRDYPGSLGITGLDIFGTHAVSIGQTMSNLEYDIEIVERSHAEDYRRFLIGDGRVIGAQVIGRNKHMGMLLSLMQRRDNVNGIRDAMLGSKLGIFQMLATVNNNLVKL